MNPFQMCGRKIVKTHARKTSGGMFLVDLRSVDLLKHWRCWSTCMREIVDSFRFGLLDVVGDCDLTPPKSNPWNPCKMGKESTNPNLATIIFSFPSMLTFQVCIYIYIYIRVIIPVRRWAKCHACQPKWVCAILQNVEKFFSHFSPTSSSCQDQMRLLVPHKSCRCYSHFWVISVHLQSIQHWHYAIKDVFMRKERHHLRSIKDAFMRKERHHLRSIKDVFMCKERHHPHPTPLSVASKMCSCARNVIIPTPPHPTPPHPKPPHCDHRRTGIITGIYIYEGIF